MKSLLISCLLVTIFIQPGFAAPTPGPDSALNQAGKQMEAAKQETQKLRDAWDKAKLEVTLYERRAKRAYQKWIKSTKTLRAQTQTAREKADLELQLAVERRKLAFVLLQEAVYRQAALDARMNELDQQKDEADIRAKLKDIESKLENAIPPQ
jgi:hypothetical protein